MIDLQEIVTHLRGVGGADVVICRDGVYELSVRELDDITAREAINNLIRRDGHDTATE